MTDTCVEGVEKAMTRLADQTKKSAFAEDQLCSCRVEAESAQLDGQQKLQLCCPEGRTCKQAVESCVSAEEDASTESTFLSDALRSFEGITFAFTTDNEDVLEVCSSNLAVLMEEV